MAIDIALKGVKVNHNGLGDNMTTGASGILNISWFHCRPDLPEPILKWTIKLDNIKKNQTVSLSKFKDYEKLAFRQNAEGESILKIEVITSKEYSFIAKLVIGVLGLGIKTVGGFIINPVASSLFDTLVSQLNLDTDKPTIYKVGTAEYIVKPDSPLPGEIEIPLVMDEMFVIQNEEKNPLTQQIVTSGISIPAGPNGVVTLNISEFPTTKKKASS